MATKNDSKTIEINEEENAVACSKSGLIESSGLGKSAKQVQNKKTSAVGKNSASYWACRIYKPVNSRGEESPHYSFQVQFKARRGSFSTGTGNKDGAAKIAASIYHDLLTTGWDATMEKHRPKKMVVPVGSSVIATVGEWIDAAKKISEANDTTFNCYACSLRKIVGDILSVKKSKKRFGPRGGGASKYRDKINAASLDVLTPAAVQKWRLAYVKLGATPAEERSRMTSCNSTIRQARSLFSSKIVELLPELRLPEPAPFHKTKFFPRQSSKYFSRIDPKQIIQQAREELYETDSPVFIAMLLALSSGLRRGEIDSLQWRQIDFKKKLIRVESTDAADLKTVDSRGEVPIDSVTADILQDFFKRRDGAFVISGAGASSGPQSWGRKYRANSVFVRVVDWLRDHGVDSQKPLHELRKELGALATAAHGIYGASRLLRHSNIATTEAHYTDLKNRPVVEIGAWLMPPNKKPLTDF